MRKRILSLLLALVLLVGLVPFGTIPARAALPDGEEATFTVSVDGNKMPITKKGNDVNLDASYEGCDKHKTSPAEGKVAYGCTITYPSGKKSVSITVNGSGDLWKSDKSHYKCFDDAVAQEVEIPSDASDFLILWDQENAQYFALYFKPCYHLSQRYDKYVSNNNGTHEVIGRCTICGVDTSSETENCRDGGDGKCFKCGYVMSAEKPTVTVTGFDAKDMVQRYDVGATAATFTVTAASSDGGQLSYQWYVNTVEGYEGAVAIDGSNTASYTPDTTTETDMRFYFCRVTNTNGTSSATVDTGLQAVVVGKVPTVTAYFSLSDDGHYVVGDNAGGGSGEVQALRKVTVPYFDLGLYGLEGFYFKSESYGPDPDNPGKPGSDLTPGTSAFAYGKITGLHLMIYMLETQYCGISEKEAGKGYLYDEGLMGTPVFNISGSTGSFFMSEVWDHDLNLNYYHNYVYPLATSGWGSTMDQILLHDGDVFSMMMFTSWSFFTDSAAGFNHFGTADNQIPAELEIVKDKKLELTLYRSYGFGEDYHTDHNVVKDELPVYYTDLDRLSDGEVTTWTACGTTSADGTFTVDAKALKLEAGKKYLFAVAGQKGKENPKDYVSAPGGVIVNVVDQITDPGKAMDVYITLDGSDCTKDFGKLDYVTVSTFEKICTNVAAALDVISDATGYTFELTNSGVVSVTNPDGVKIANGQFGPNSKWTLKVNGEDPTDYAEDGVLGHCKVWDGDEFVITYAECGTADGNHTWDKGKVTKEATCKDEGVRTYTCTVCGVTKTEPIEKLTTHTWDAGKVTKKPTAQAEGEMTYTCTVCGKTKTEVIEKLKACDGGKDCISHKFTDVNAGKWYHEAVDYAVEKGLFAGTSDTTFEPNSSMTRAMLVAVLWRAAGRPAAKTAASFQDVNPNQYYAEAVAWAKENGIVAGTSDTTFSPNETITREQMAAILYRYAKLCGVDVTKSADLKTFPDADKVSKYAKDALAWAVGDGIISGSADGGRTYLDPKGNATRAQVAAILMRYLEKYGK